MSRARRLGTLERLAAMGEQASRTALARATQELARRERQQRQLEEYEAEYARGWIEAGRGGVAGQRLVGLAAFRAGLSRSIDAQQQAVATAAEARAPAASRWRTQRERLRTWSDLVARAAAGEAREAERRAQREVEDAAAARRPAR